MIFFLLVSVRIALMVHIVSEELIFARTFLRRKCVNIAIVSSIIIYTMVSGA